MNKSEESEPFSRDSLESQKEVFVPLYNAEDQFTVDQLRQEYPEWHKHYGGDAELTAISYERTSALRKLGQQIGVGGSIMHEIGGEGLKWSIEHTPKEVGMAYDAHGIAGKRDPVMELDQLLKEGIKSDRPFYSMSFVHSPEAAEAFGADRPFTSGGFVLLADKGKKLQSDGIK